MKKKRRASLINAKTLFAGPFVVFLLMMVVFPMILLLIASFRGPDGSFTFSNFGDLFTGGIPGFSAAILFRSIGIALAAAFVCLIIAYPIAYGLAMTGFKRGPTIILLFLLPMWINMLLRSFALLQLYRLVGIQDGFWALLIAIVVDYLPLMILPIYIVLSNIPKKLIEASYDLGCKPRQAFFKTIVPLSVPGVIAGFLLVFTPAVSSYFLPHFFGNNRTFMIGQTLEALWGNPNFGFGWGSVVSLVLLLLIGASVLITNRFSKIGNKRGGLW